MTKVTLFKKIYFMCSFLAVSGLCCYAGFPLVAGSRVYSPLVVHGLLFVVTSPVVEHGLWDTWAFVAVAPRLQSTGSIVVAHRLSCCPTWEVLPDQGSNLCLLHWQENSFTTEPPGKP